MISAHSRRLSQIPLETTLFPTLLPFVWLKGVFIEIQSMKTYRCGVTASTGAKGANKSISIQPDNIRTNFSVLKEYW